MTLHTQPGVSGLEQLALPRSAARVLAASAGSGSCAGMALNDAVAEGVFQRLGGDFGSFQRSELRATAFRTLVIDELARLRLSLDPRMLGVGVWPLLGTRGHRLAERWVDVDAPQVARLRRYLLPQRYGWLQVSSCLCDSSWLDAVSGKEGRRLFLVLDESALPLEPETMMHFLDGVSLRARAGSELLITFDVHAPLRPSAPFCRTSAIELILGGSFSLARYPRLRVIDPRDYPERLRARFAGVNAVARRARGVAAPALAHLRVV